MAVSSWCSFISSSPMYLESESKFRLRLKFDGNLSSPQTLLPGAPCPFLFSNPFSFRMQMIPLCDSPPSLLSHHQTSGHSFSLMEGLFLLTLPLTSNVLLEEPPSTLVLTHISDHFHYATSATCSSKVCKAYSTSCGLAHQNLLLSLLVLIC